jgi:hypothetical protein
MDRLSIGALSDELNALDRSGALSKIARAEAIVSELIRREKVSGGSDARGLRELLSQRGGIRATLGSRGAVRWLMSAAEDHARAARMAFTGGQCAWQSVSATERYGLLNRFDLQRTWLSYMRQFPPREPRGLRPTIFALKHAKRHAEELTVHDLFIRLSGRSARPLIDRAVCLRELGRVDEAEREVDEGWRLLSTSALHRIRCIMSGLCCGRPIGTATRWTA